MSRRLREIEKRIASLEEAVKARAGAQGSTSGEPAPRVQFGDLPISLSKSLQAMQALGQADATAVSQKTGRNRSVETIYLNQLVRLGTLSRSRIGKKVFFRLAKVY